jgi:cytochrome P450
MTVGPSVGTSLYDRLGALFDSDPVAMADAPELYGALREAGPVHEFGPVVLVTPHAECKAVFRDSERFASGGYRAGSFAAANRARLTPEQQGAFDELNRFDSMRMTATNGPYHMRLRTGAHRAFTPARIRELTDAVHAYLDELLAREHADTIDLMVLAYQLPLMVIADLLGVPQADRELVHGWSTAIGRNRGGVDPVWLMQAYEAVPAFAAYVSRIVDEHRSSVRPTQLVAALVDAEQDDRLNTEEVIVTYMTLLFAGHETTTNLIGTGMLELLRRPDQWRQLTDDPGIAAAATEELLRFVTPVQFSNRVATTDVEIAGMGIAEGTTVRVMTAGANHDPAVFEDPDMLVVTRQNARDHLALGFGPHFCLGNALARLEGAIVFATLAERFPTMTLATDSHEWTGSVTLRRLAHLPVNLRSRPSRQIRLQAR